MEMVVASLEEVAEIAKESPVAGMPPPHSFEAEAAVLSAVMLDKTAILKVVDFLRPQHFWSEASRQIFAACMRLHAKGSPIDSTLVLDDIRDNERAGQVPATLIAEILDASPAVSNVREHAVVVFNKWRMRELIRITDAVSKRGYVRAGDVQEYCDRAAKAVLQIAQNTIHGRPESNVDALKRITRELEDQQNDGAPASGKGKRGIRTGIHAYDSTTQGLHVGQKTTIVAHQGCGKTAIATQMGWDIAEAGIGVFMISTELSRDELLKREICRRATLPYDRLLQGKLTADEWSRYARAASVIGSLPFVIHNAPSININQIRSMVRSEAETFKYTHGVPLGVFIFDFIQNVEPPPEMARARKHEYVGHASWGLQKLSKELEIATIEIAQRKQADIDPKTKLRPKPDKNATGESSDPEKSSYVVVVLQRAPLHNDSGVVVGEDQRTIDLHFTKNRNGAETSKHVRFDGEYFRFTDPNAPSPSPARQYVDPEPEPPPGFFDDFAGGDA